MMHLKCTITPWLTHKIMLSAKLIQTEHSKGLVKTANCWCSQDETATGGCVCINETIRRNHTKRTQHHKCQTNAARHGKRPKWLHNQNATTPSLSKHKFSMCAVRTMSTWRLGYLAFDYELVTVTQLASQLVNPLTNWVNVNHVKHASLQPVPVMAG